EDGIRDDLVTGVQTCALPICCLPMLDSDLSLDFLRVVEQAAIACATTMGQGDRHKSDAVAAEAMRKEMDSVPIDGTIVIGEGEQIGRASCRERGERWGGAW